MAVTITYFVHGTTTDNERHLATGWSPGELSEKGIEESKKLAAQVSHLRFDAVFCSDLKRAVDSARLAFEGYPILEDKRLRECDYGDLTGHPAGEFKPNMDKYVDEPFPNGESYHDVEARIADFLGFLGKEYPGKHIAVFAHQAPQLALEVLLKGRTWEQAIDEDWRKRKAWQPGWTYVLR